MEFGKIKQINILSFYKKIKNICHLNCLLLIVGISASCEYNLNDDYLYPITQIQSNLKNLDFKNQDTLYIKDVMTFSFSIMDYNEIIYSEISIDDSVIVSENGRFSMTFNPYTYKSGYHILKYILHEKTNSNSLADELNAEYFEHTYIKVILIDTDPLEKLFIESAKTKNGVLEITWNEYTGYKFDRYEIRIGAKNVVIKDASQHTMTIPEFAGGTLDVAFNIYAKEDEQVYSYDRYDYDFGLIADYVSQNKLGVKWSESPFNSTSGFKIRLYNDYNDANEFVGEYIFQEVTEKNEINTALIFPYSYRLELVALSQFPEFEREADNIYFESKYLNDKLDFLKYEGKYYSKYHRIYHEEGDIYRTISYDDGGCCYDKYIRFDVKTGEILAEISGSLSLTPDGKKLFGAKMTNLYNLYATEYDPKTLAIIREEHFEVDAHDLRINAIKVSNNGVLAIGYGSSKFILFDWNLDVINAEGNAGNTLFKNPYVFLNIDGINIMTDNRYADLTASGGVQYKNVNDSYSLVKTLPGRNMYLYYVSGRIGLADFLGNTTKTYNSPNTVIEFIRSENDNFAVLSEDTDGTFVIEIFDYSLTEPKYSLDISPDIIDGAYKFSLTDNQLFIQSPEKVYMHSFN